MHYYFWLNLGQIFVKLAARDGCEPGLGWMLVLRVSGQRGCELSETCRRLGPPEPEPESGPTSADAEAFQWFMT